MARRDGGRTLGAAQAPPCARRAHQRGLCAGDGRAVGRDAMSRLQPELDRLYLTGSSATAGADAPSTRLVDAQGRVRALVMKLVQPASWEVLSRVWHGVQIELELPAPAIAVSGIDGLQLWFSLAEPVAASQAHAFVDALRSRFLPDIASARVRLMPASD